MHCNRSVFGNLRPHQCHAENGGEITYFEYVSETQQQAQDSRTCNLLMCTLWKKHEIAISYSSEGDLCLQLMLWDANAVIIRNQINLEKKKYKTAMLLICQYKECVFVSAAWLNSRKAFIIANMNIENVTLRFTDSTQNKGNKRYKKPILCISKAYNKHFSTK